MPSTIANSCRCAHRIPSPQVNTPAHSGQRSKLLSTSTTRSGYSRLRCVVADDIENGIDVAHRIVERHLAVRTQAHDRMVGPVAELAALTEREC